MIILYSTVLFILLNPVIHYVLHKKYYAEVLCQNKDKPMMHCNGKCHLKKEIKAQNNDQNPNKPVPIPQNRKEIFPVILDINSNSNFSFYFIRHLGLVYLLPALNDVFLDIPTPPPEF